MIATSCELADRELVAEVRAGDDAAFEELYRRYRARVTGYVRGMVRDEARAEDIAQDAFLSALRRMRVTETEIAFKPWIFEIARNAAIDHHRRTSRAEEVSMDAQVGLRPSDHGRLAGGTAPDSALMAKERLDHLCGAFDELSDVHTRVLVLRELEGLSYRDIGEELDLTRSSVESALFRARRRLEREYEELSEGRRCEAMRGVIARIAEGVRCGADERRLARHARRCHTCRRRARELGVEPLAPLAGVRARAAALLPLPWLLRGRGAEAGAGGGTSGGLSGLLSGGGQLGGAIAERTAALVAAAAVAGAGGAALVGSGAPDRERDPAATKPAPNAAEQRTAGAPTDAGDAAPTAGGAKKLRSAPSKRNGEALRSGRGRAASTGALAPDAGGAAGRTDTPAPASGGEPAGLPRLPELPGAIRPTPPSAPSGDRILPSLPEVKPPVKAPQVRVPQVPAVDPPPGVPLPEVPAAPDPSGRVESVTGAVQGTLP